jgi:hypothetical protein
MFHTKRWALVLLVCVFGLSMALVTVVATGQETPPIPTDEPPTGAAVFVSRNNVGRISDAHLSVFGPLSCTGLGDPFSPITPTWTATPWLDPADFTGVYTYHFQIRIPASYPDEMVRVEIFDPDSMNKADNSAQVVFSSLAQSLNPTLFPPTPQTFSCPYWGARRTEPCIIPTGEHGLVNEPVTLDHINPFWFVRIDENRHGCGSPPNYNALYNTQTLYRLSYFRNGINGAREKVVLAEYTGQTGDGVRDDGDHDTDLRWVSPGGQPGFDQPVFVPADFGSFEVNLAQDAPDILVDPVTGERLLYVAVTAVSGESENGFQLWAGPSSYVNTIPGDVNSRNLYLLNHPGSHSSGGVTIAALDFLPVNSNAVYRVPVPLTTIGPEYAGQTVHVSLFDPDSGARPPIIFYLDSLAFKPDNSTDGVDESATDFALSFGGATDPLGRCFAGGAAYFGACHDKWINPSYTITIPSEQDCDYDNPTAATCTPFYGGQLWASMQTGTHDTFAWSVVVPERPLLDPTLGCSAFPIGIQTAVRSVLPPGGPGGLPNSWPANFDYPAGGVDYDWFENHIPDILLADAQPGYRYKLNANLFPGDFHFLRWNECVGSTTDLAGSLAWPGNSGDYRPLPGGCAPFTPRVRGYVEPGDPTDRALNQGDWTAVYTGLINSRLYPPLQAHIDRERMLRLPVWQADNGGGAGAAVQTVRLALFRLVGYTLSQPADNWLMVEFVRWDDSCGQLAMPHTPLSALTLTGPEMGEINAPVGLTAVVSPTTATLPIFYTWEATDLDAITRSGGVTDSPLFNWALPGVKTITVTATNGENSLIATHAITIASPMQAPLVVTVVGPASGLVQDLHTFTATISPPTTTLPITYTWHISGQTPIVHVGGLSDVAQLSWPNSGQTGFWLTVENEVDFAQTWLEFEVLPRRLFLPLVGG